MLSLLLRACLAVACVGLLFAGPGSQQQVLPEGDGLEPLVPSRCRRVADGHARRFAGGFSDAGFQRGAVRPDRREPVRAGGGGTAVDVLDRRGHGQLRERAAIPRGWRAAAEGRGADRGAGECVRLRVPGAGVGRGGAADRPFGRGGLPVDAGSPAGPRGHAGAAGSAGGAARGEPGVPARHVGQHGLCRQAPAGEGRGVGVAPAPHGEGPGGGGGLRRVRGARAPADAGGSAGPHRGGGRGARRRMAGRADPRGSSSLTSWRRSNSSRAGSTG